MGICKIFYFSNNLTISNNLTVSNKYLTITNKYLTRLEGETSAPQSISDHEEL